MKKILTELSAMTLVLALASCGGSNDQDTRQTVSGSITGVAATGAAISGGLVTLKCAGGLSSATTSTSADGAYSFTLNNVTLPCLAQVSYTDDGVDTRTLHAYVGSTGTSNITPLTELLLAQLSGKTPIDAFTLFTNNTAISYKTAEIDSALAALKTKLLTVGITLPNDIDPLRGQLVAKTDSQYGNAHDVALDNLATSLQNAGITLERLTLLVSHGLAVDDDIAAILAQDVESHDLQGTHSGFLKNTETPCSFSIDAAGSILPDYLPVYPSQMIFIPNMPVADGISGGITFLPPIATLNANNVKLSHTEFTGLVTYTASTSAFLFSHEWHYLKQSAPGAFNTSADFIANKAGYRATLRKVSNVARISTDSPVGALIITNPEAHIELEINGLKIPTRFGFPPVPIPLTCIGSSYRI